MGKKHGSESENQQVQQASEWTQQSSQHWPCSEIRQPMDAQVLMWKAGRCSRVLEPWSQTLTGPLSSPMA